MKKKIKQPLISIKSVVKDPCPKVSYQLFKKAFCLVLGDLAYDNDSFCKIIIFKTFVFVKHSINSEN